MTPVARDAAKTPRHLRAGRGEPISGPRDEPRLRGTQVRRVAPEHVGRYGWLVGLVFVLGTMLGSFVNVLIHRLPRRESIVTPGSRCPHCHTPIRPWDNLPILSYLLLRGRCRRCGSRISPRYLIVEVAGGALLAALVWRFGLTVVTLRFAILAFALLVVFFTDLETGLIPNAITYPGIVVGLLLAAASGRDAFVSALLTATGAGGVFLLIGILSSWAFHQEAMGAGDMKLAAMLGAFLGTPGVIVALFLAVAIGAAAGLILIALRLRTRKDVIPFGTALAAGAVIAMFGQEAILRWYLGRLL
jgi:leader peptidase (prepilin peptidase) / N-methyltransferase